MFGLFKGSSSTAPKNIWSVLDSDDQLSSSLDDSFHRPVVIFKHSTRCSISSLAKNRLEQEWELTFGDHQIYYLDLIAFRSISNAVAEKLDVEHQSPQIIVIKEGKAVYNASHSSINVEDLRPYISL